MNRHRARPRRLLRPRVTTTGTPRAACNASARLAAPDASNRASSDCASDSLTISGSLVRKVATFTSMTGARLSTEPVTALNAEVGHRIHDRRRAFSLAHEDQRTLM